MKLAIPIFLNRISPRLDCAKQLLILEVDNDRLFDKRVLDISQWAPDEKIEFLKKMGINQLICGGIRLEDRSGLHRLGIQVVSPLYGEVDTIIKKYLSGRLALSCPRARLRKGRRKRCL